MREFSENHGNGDDGDGDNEGWRVVTDSMGHRTGGDKAGPKPAAIAGRPAGTPLLLSALGRVTW